MNFIKHKKLVISFFTLLFVVAAVFTACSPDNASTTTTDNETTTAANGLVPVTNESGDTLTTIIIDENGNEKTHILMQPAEGNNGNDNIQAVESTPDNQNGNQGNSNTPTLPGEVINPDDNSNPQLKAMNEIIKAFNSGRYKFAGTMPASDGEEASNAEMIIFEGNLSAKMALDGVELDLRVIDGKMYFLNHAKKKYCELNETTMKAVGLNMDNFDIDDLKTSMGSDIRAAGEPEISTVTLDGKALTKYDYPKTDGGRKIFYLDSANKLVRMDVVAKDAGNVDIYTFTAFETNITKADVEIPSDFSKQVLMTFMMGLMGDLANSD